MAPDTLALAALAAPLLAFFVAFVGLRHRHAAAATVVLVAGVIAAASTLLLLAGGVPDETTYRWSWFTLTGVDLRFGFLLDGRTLLMGSIVGVITLCIQVYSLGYMAHDPGKGRFFAFLGLFEWAMLGFVYAPDLLQAFIFWELVGLASFLLIGFWYRKPSAIAASKKAFIMTRIGDVGMLIGLVLLFDLTGTLGIPELGALFGAEGLPAGMDPGRIELVAALLFVGVIGKSAQFPLHTWLPDAMEGPTPVSALLHSATMVAAGVFLVARFHELFMDAPTTLSWMLGIAAFTAVLASTMAMVAKDIKKVLAYSSISQLGYMLLGLGAGSLFAGMFHLTTHAAFKALLFLCAGAYIHHHGTNDMIAIGRDGGRKMKITTLGLVAGGAALAGVPVFAGFFSKEAILGALHGHPMVLAAAYVAAFMTAYYTFRVVFMILRPNADSAAVPDEAAGAQHASHGDHGDHDGHDHGAAEPATMMAPIALLTLAAVGLGFFGDAMGELLGLSDQVIHPALAEMLPAIGVVLAGIAMAWLDFGRAGAAQTGFVAKIPALQRALENRWYIDALYTRTFVRLSDALASGSYAAETKGFDGAGDAVGAGTLAAGAQVAEGQTGRLQIYLAVAALVVAGAVYMVGM